MSRRSMLELHVRTGSDTSFLLRRYLALGLLTLVFVLGSCGGNNETPKYSDEELERVIAIQDRYTDSLLAIPGVNGVGTSVDDKGQLIIVVTKEFEGGQEIPSKLDGVPVKVEVIGKVVPYLCNQRHRPTHIGTSIGDTSGIAAGMCSAGTFGCVVVIGEEQFILSNNHVLAGLNQTVMGCPIVQPGALDSNPVCGYRPTDAIAELSDFEPISFTDDNYIDAAVARLRLPDDQIECSTLPQFYGEPGDSIVNARAGLGIKKVGRTTCLTRGSISRINQAIEVHYAGGMAKFKKQHMTTPGFSKPGDSGSLVVTDDDESNPVGLLFAGAPNGISFLNPIDAVLSRFSASICPAEIDSLDIDSLMSSLFPPIEHWEMTCSNYADADNPNIVEPKVDFSFLTERKWDCEVRMPLPSGDQTATLSIKDFDESNQAEWLRDLSFACKIDGLNWSSNTPYDENRHIPLRARIHGAAITGYQLSLRFSADRQTAFGSLSVVCAYPAAGLVGSCSVKMKRIQ